MRNRNDLFYIDKKICRGKKNANYSCVSIHTLL